MTAPASPAKRLPASIWALGFVSLLMDVSSEMIHSLLPLFMVTVLGSSALTIGLIEGMAEATALMVKVFSGKAKDVSVLTYVISLLFLIKFFVVV